MPPRTPAAAVRELRDHARLVLLCITNVHLAISPGGYEPSPTPHGLTLATDPAPLRGSGGLALSVRHYYWIAHDQARAEWRAETAAYYYSISDRGGREILGYHWHPMTPTIAYPHLHIEPGAVRREVLERASLTAAANGLRSDLAAAHLPTHHISLEGFARLLITQFGVTPRRRDWERVLQE